MFQFSGLAARTYGLGSRLFGNLRIKACLTAPRSFSQFSAPFKAFRRQDVPHALFLRLIAPIHHSLRNNRIDLFSILSIYYRNVSSTPCEAQKTNTPTDRAVSDPLDSRPKFLDKIPKNVTFFEYSCYRSIKLLNSVFDKIIVMFLRSAAQPTYAPAPLDPLTLTANASNSAQTVDKRQNPRRHSCIT